MTSSSAATAYEHIHLDEKGVPLFEGTTMKVVELVMAQKADGCSPEELHFQHPYLTISQIHSALAYYWEHKEAVDADIARRGKLVERRREESGPSPLSDQLRDRGSRE